MILTSNINDRSLEGNTGRVMNFHYHGWGSDISGHPVDHRVGGWSDVLERPVLRTLCGNV